MAQASAAVDASPAPRQGILRALRHRNYRLFFGGQIISLVGTFLTNTATSWLAFTLAHDRAHAGRLLGIVGFAGQIPMFFLTPLAGVWVDRLNRQKLLVVTQTLAMLQSFVLAVLALTNRINITEVIVLSVVQGIINAIDMPGRQAFLVEMVTDREDLANAIALNSSMVHAARLIGPATAGLIIAFFSTGWCFLLDGLSYIAVIAALVAMTIQPRPPRASRSVLTEMIEGFRYVWGFKPIRALLMLMAVFSLTGIPAMMILMPIFGDHFGGEAHGAQVFGFLSAASAVGAFIGAVYLASRKTVLGLGRLIAISSFVYAIAIAAFALSPYLWLSFLIVPIGGWAMIINFASANTILQTLADDDMRGRVMSFFSMCFVGITPFGVLIAGELATRLAPPTAEPSVGASRTILLASGVCLIASILFWKVLPGLRKLVRPIYVKRGILKEIAEGIQSATEATDRME